MPLKISFKLFVIAAFSAASIETSNASDKLVKVLDVGEMLKYEISYGFIKLGEITFKLSNKRKDGSKNIYNASLQIKSYPEIPFVKINEIMETEMELDDQAEDVWDLFSKKYFETKFGDKTITRVEYKFDYKSKVVKVVNETDGNINKDQVVAIGENVRYKDRISWQYNCRLHSFTNKNFNVPVFINDEPSSIRYSYNANKTIVNIEKFDYEISVIKLEGTADYTGFFGFTGEFLIMYSADEYRVPIKAYFNSSLGNIVWELKDYKKGSWKPPAFFAEN